MPVPETEPLPASGPTLSVATTALVVEDCLSSVAAIRLMARLCGLRVRHAASLEAARGHLAIFRPALLIVDLGLPDGSGTELLRCLAAEPPPRPRLLAVSADERLLADPEVAALSDGRAAKPFASLAEFHAAVLPHVPARGRAAGTATAAPDPALVRADFARARDILARAAGSGDRALLAFGARFAAGLAAELRDGEVRLASERLLATLGAGDATREAGRRLLALCEHRLAPVAAEP